MSEGSFGVVGASRLLVLFLPAAAMALPGNGDAMHAPARAIGIAFEMTQGPAILEYSQTDASQIASSTGSDAKRMRVAAESPPAAEAPAQGFDALFADLSRAVEAAPDPAMDDAQDTSSIQAQAQLYRRRVDAVGSGWPERMKNIAIAALVPEDMNEDAQFVYTRRSAATLHR